MLEAVMEEGINFKGVDWQIMNGGNNVLEVRLLSSLEKVFADRELDSPARHSGSVLYNEIYSFQIAYRRIQQSHCIEKVKLKVVSELKPWITLRKVGLVPSEMPCHSDYDDNVLRATPGLYPDVLAPYCENDGLILLPEQWRAVWVSVDALDEVKPGKYPVELVFKAMDEDELAREVFYLDVIGARLPKQTLLHTEWFHADCIATWYEVEIFSDEHWRRIEQYIKTAVRHGINMILTPVFTPPLDTEPDGERPTVQLADVEKKGSGYTFNFDKLERWVALCKSNGIEYFEISHLFTQWGALHAPKIMAYEGGEMKRIFGWDTDAAGEEYKCFLDQFLPALLGFIREKGLEDSTYFHVSDEPSLEHMMSYESARKIMEKHLGWYPVIDALSDYEFYTKGLVKNPVPSTDHIEPFLDNGLPGLWTYYCNAQHRKVSNRFFNMPSCRNRIIGVQIYKHNIAGFLHWGYNFWYSQYSRYPIDPYRMTDAGCAFPSGDSFLVYPAEEGPLESIRLEVFYEALQDIRALGLLERKIGRAAVIEMLEAGLDEPLTFSSYPAAADWLLKKREEINRRIAIENKIDNI
jgi:hypothetical protein